MNLERFLSLRLIFFLKKDRKISRPIMRMVIFGISLSLAIMLISVAIVTGFKDEIQKKLTGFSAHIKIQHLDNNTTYETYPITNNPHTIKQLKDIDNVSHVQVFATKPGIIKTNKAIQGIIIYGIDANFDWQFFISNLTEGEVFRVNDSINSDHIIISKYLADLLNLKVGSKIDIYFIQKHVRARRFKLVGIYNTGMEEFDKLIALCDIKHVQKLNNWDKNKISGFSVFLNDISKLKQSTQDIFKLLANQPDHEGNLLNVKNIKELYPLIFDWLALIDVNVWFILTLLLIVASFNMISGVLVLILEKTKLIAILKSVGMNNWQISKVFLHISSYIVFKGMIWGNIFAIILLAIQHYLKIIKLNPELYFIDTIPINFRFDYWLLINILTFILILIINILPIYLITKISPTKILRLI